MKNYWKPALCIAILACGACHNEKKDIEAVGLAYLDAMGNYRINDAKPYASKETQETTINFIENFIMPQADTNAQLSDFIKSNTPATITINTINRNSDTTAIVSYTKKTPLQTQNSTLNLIKRNGKWKAHVLIKIPNAMKVATEPIQYPDTTNLKAKPLDNAR